MKKLMLAFAMLLTMSTVSFAQTRQSGKKKDNTAAAPVAKSSRQAKQESTGTTAPEVAKPAPSQKAGPAKKDGTPDKRYKANKVAADTTVHKKKDGTPDKRFKENKKKN